jgi:hypothetical protein
MAGKIPPQFLPGYKKKGTTSPASKPPAKTTKPTKGKVPPQFLPGYKKKGS